MRASLFGIVICAPLILCVLSCAGLPAGKKAAVPEAAKTAEPSSLDTAAVETEPVVATANPPLAEPTAPLGDQVSSVSSVEELKEPELPAEDLPKITEPPVADETPLGTAQEFAPPSVPEKPSPAPAIPLADSEERLLYFYPEPDPAFIVPIVPAAEVAPPANAAQSAAKSPSPPATEKAAAAKPASEAKIEPSVKVQPDDPGKATQAEILPGIWESEPVAPSLPAAKPSPAVVASRAVTLAAGQSLEVWYPGSGWVYLGDASAQNGLSYVNRKLDKTDTLFSFKALKPGNYILEFTRFDVLEDSFASDALAVTVTDVSGKTIEKVRAPNYVVAFAGDSSATVSSSMPTASATSTLAATVVTPQSASSGITEEPSLLSGTTSPAKAGAATNPSGAGGASPSTTATGASAASAATFLDKARASLSSGDPAAALSALEGFFAVAVDSADEGLFLQGQAYEANGSTRDIRKALAAYETLVSAYPDSARWSEADARIRFIKQFYLRIR